MKYKKHLAIISLILCISLLTACNSEIASSEDTEIVEQQIVDKQPDQQKNNEMTDTFSEENVDISSSQGPSSIDEKLDGSEDSTSVTAETANTEQVDRPSTSTTSDINTEPVGKVEFTNLPSEETEAFNGKEIYYDTDIIGQELSPDIYSCNMPLSRIELHPILQWAKDYSSYTISDEVLGVIENTGEEEPFRIYDTFPDGFPMNCVLFYLEDGTCGTFSLGYTESGEEYTWENRIYNNLASLNAALAKQIEEGAVSAILNEYESIIHKYSNGGWGEDEGHKHFHQEMQYSVIPQFGKVYYDEDNVPFCSETESHFLEIIEYAWKDLGIAYLDLNGDSTDELVIGYDTPEEEINQPTQLIAAYSVKNGNIQTLFHGWSRSSYYLTEDAFIIHPGSSGYMDFSIIKYKVSEDDTGALSLKEIESVVVDGNKNPERPYSYYHEERQIAGYDEYGSPIYSSENALQMDKETGDKYYNRLSDEEIHIDLKHFDVT